MEAEEDIAVANACDGSVLDPEDPPERRAEDDDDEEEEDAEEGRPPNTLEPSGSRRLEPANAGGGAPEIKPSALPPMADEGNEDIDDDADDDDDEGVVDVDGNAVGIAGMPLMERRASRR